MRTRSGTFRLMSAAILAAGLLAGGAVRADVVTAVKDAADFSHVFAGTDIHDGTSYQSGWGEFSAGAATVFTDLGGGVLGISNTGGGVMVNGSLSTDGSTTWVDNLVIPIGADSAYTIEIQMKVNDSPNGVRLWSGMGDGRDWLDVYNDGVVITQPGGGFVNVPLTMNDGEVHTFRLANDGNLSNDILTLAHVWVDGVQLTEPGGNPWTSSSNDSRLLFGDSTNQAFGDDYDVDIHSFAYDQSGAFKPIPEPSTLALLVFSALAIGARRRKR